MLLKAGNAPRNGLLDDGFDLQYIARRNGPPDNDAMNEHFTDQHIILPITWPYGQDTCRFGNGNVVVKILQSKSCKPIRLKTDELVTILGVEDRLLDIHLLETATYGVAFATLRITYGTCPEDALSEEHLLAATQEGYLH